VAGQGQSQNQETGGVTGIKKAASTGKDVAQGLEAGAGAGAGANHQQSTGSKIDIMVGIAALGQATADTGQH
jgi:hypothetical protein